MIETLQWKDIAWKELMDNSILQYTDIGSVPARKIQAARDILAGTASCLDQKARKHAEHIAGLAQKSNQAKQDWQLA